jgi:hypothetical protein
MLRRWLDVAVARPELLADHAGAWGHFLASEIAPAWQARQRVVVLWSLGLLNGSLGLALAGVALMLGVVTPTEQWSLWPVQLVLWLVPAVPLLLAVVCVMAARRKLDDGAWARVRRQWAADLALWQQAGAEQARP